VLDVPRFEWWLRRSWIRIRNREERLQLAPDGRGVACPWRWTSDLHVAKVFPVLGSRLLQRATAAWPITFADAPPEAGGDVEVSFVIGHRGADRLPQLLATLRTIAAQRDVRCECIVVEQSAQSEAGPRLPSWVRHVHTPLPSAAMPYCRSWAFNVGARSARGAVLVFHDNDLLVPERYAAEVRDRHREGYEVVNLKRFIFYLSERHSRDTETAGRLSATTPPVAIVQNAVGGGSVAVARDAFFAIGGYDESFVGWGGEDNEFWERAQRLRVWPFASLPLVHLWHPPQPDKLRASRTSAAHFERRSALPPQARVAELAARDFGNPARMDPRWPTAGAGA
jgi:hypothetical protein